MGCGSKSEAPAAAAKSGPPAVAAAAPTGATAGGGKAVYDQHCAKCHGGGKAPDLSSVGASP